MESLSPLTADVALAVLAQLCEPSVGNKPQYPLLESVRITADAILHYKGIQRWGRERWLLHEQIFAEMERLRCLHFDVEHFPVWNPATRKWDPRGASWQGDRLFDIVKVEMAQESLSSDRPQIDVSWLVRAGQWAYWWLNAQGRVWIGRMARVLLELDHRYNRGAVVLAKKVGQRMVLLGEALHLDEPMERRVVRILEDVGELPAPEQRTRHWAGRTRERFDTGLPLLRDVGIFSALAWPDGYGPGDADRSKGWVDGWLTARVHMTLSDKPPALSPGNTAHHGQRQQRKKRRGVPSSTAGQGVDGAAVRRARAEWAWRQEVLARHLGISSPYLSQIETGKRVPSATLARKLQTWLQEGG